MSEIVRGTVKLSDVTTGCQQLQLDLLEDETVDDIEFFEQPGCSFRAEDDVDVLALRIGGSQMNLAAIGTSARGKRPTVAIEKGEGGLYYAGVYRVFLKADGTVYLGTKDATDFVALATKVLIELNDIRTKFDAHTHPYVNVATPATTSAPTVPIGPASSVAATKVKAV